MENNRVIHFEVQADDVARAKMFYEETFGWQINQIMTAGKDGAMNYWGLKTGEDKTPGINGGLYQRPNDKKIYTYDCTILVKDIDKSIQMVKKNGGKIIVDKNEIPKVGWFAGCTDTEGNKFGLMQAADWKPM